MQGFTAVLKVELGCEFFVAVVFAMNEINAAFYKDPFCKIIFLDIKHAVHCRVPIKQIAGLLHLNARDQ